MSLISKPLSPSERKVLLNSSLERISQALLDREWNVDSGNAGDADELNKSDSMVSAPPPRDLDSVVTVIYLAVDHGMNPAVWLEVENEGIEEEYDNVASYRDGLLATSEFMKRMQSLKLVLGTWESIPHSNLTEDNVPNIDPRTGELTIREKELVCEMFGVDGSWAETDKTLRETEGSVATPYIDVKSFLFHCYERMEDVELHFKASQIEREQALLESHLDEAKIRSSLDDLEMAREARAAARLEEEERMEAFIKEQDRTGGVLFSPNAVVTYDTLPDSPFDEEVAFDYDPDGDEIDSQVGLEQIRLKQKESERQEKKAAVAAQRKEQKVLKRSERLSKKSEMAKKRKGNSVADDLSHIESHLGKQGAQLDVVEDLLRNIVKQSNQYLAVQVRFGFIEPVAGAGGDAEGSIGHPRTSIPQGYRRRLSVSDVMDGFLACHLVLSKHQVDLLFVLVAKHAKARIRQAGQLPSRRREPHERDTEDQSAAHGGGGGGGGEAHGGGDGTSGRPSPSLSSSMETEKKSNMRSSSRDINTLMGPRPSRSSSPSTSRHFTSPGKEHSFADLFSPSNVTINSSASAVTSGGQKTSGGTGDDSDSKASPGAGLSSLSARTFRQSMLVAGSNVPIPSREKTVLRGKLSAIWLRDYLHLLRLTRKTVPAVAAIALLKAESGEAIDPSFPSSGGVREAIDPSFPSSPPSPSPARVGHPPSAGTSRKSKVVASHAIAALADEEETDDDDESYDDNDDDGNDDDDDDDDGKQRVMPRALHRALKGKPFFINDHELDNLVDLYAKHAALHGDGAGPYRGVIVPQAYIDKEVLIRIQRWVGNVDACSNFAHKFRTALRQQGVLGGSEGSALSDKSRAGAVSGEDLTLQHKQVRQMLVDEKVEEYRAGERLNGSITKELFWKYIAYCREMTFKGACSFSHWLKWRHNNFSNTHRAVVAYRQKAEERLKQSKQQQRGRAQETAQSVGESAAGHGSPPRVSPPRGRNASPAPPGPPIAFGTKVAINRFGTKDKNVGQSMHASRSGSPESRRGASPSPARDEGSSIKMAPEHLAARIEDELDAAEKEQKRVAAHLLWKRHKQLEFRKSKEAEHHAGHREAKQERRRKKAADAEFKTWLKLRAYNKFAVKDEKGDVVEIKDYPFAPHNTSVTVVHPKEWNERPTVLTKTVVKTCVDAAGETHEYKYRVRVDPLAVQREMSSLKQQNRRQAEKKSRKPSVPKQKVTSKKASHAKKQRKSSSSGDILNVSVSSIQSL